MLLETLVPTLVQINHHRNIKLAYLEAAFNGLEVEQEAKTAYKEVIPLLSANLNALESVCGLLRDEFNRIRENNVDDARALYEDIKSRIKLPPIEVLLNNFVETNYNVDRKKMLLKSAYDGENLFGNDPNVITEYGRLLHRVSLNYIDPKNWETTAHLCDMCEGIRVHFLKMESLDPEKRTTLYENTVTKIDSSSPKFQEKARLLQYIERNNFSKEQTEQLVKVYPLAKEAVDALKKELPSIVPLEQFNKALEEKMAELVQQKQKQTTKGNKNNTPKRKM